MGSHLRLWQLISPALPVGAYSYSQGLEYAVECDWVDSAGTAADWIQGLLKHSLAHLDVPVLQRLHAAWRADDKDKLIYWNNFLLASRETMELRAEDRSMGQALAMLLPELGLQEAEAWKRNETVPSFALMFTLAAARWEVDAEQAAEGFLWAWCENQVMAAVKLVPLGQTAGQKLLLNSASMIPEAVKRGFELTDDEIGWLAPGFALASAKHETQYTRLFRS
ncbi:MAG TPA: urease accessory protein UreF [Gammaproteobacteria bacterium]